MVVILQPKVALCWVDSPACTLPSCTTLISYFYIIFFLLTAAMYVPVKTRCELLQFDCYSQICSGELILQIQLGRHIAQHIT